MPSKVDRRRRRRLAYLAACLNICLLRGGNATAEQDVLPPEQVAERAEAQSPSSSTQWNKRALIRKYRSNK